MKDPKILDEPESLLHYLDFFVLLQGVCVYIYITVYVYV